MRVLLKKAAEITGLSQHELRTGAKAGKYPCLYVGNRIVFDIELLEESLRNLALQNIAVSKDSGIRQVK